jgi:hypothetical protein
MATQGKQKSMPLITAEIQSALEKIIGKENVLDWSLELTTPKIKFDSLSIANKRYLSSDKYDLIYGEGDRELVISAFEDEMTDDFESEPF